MVEGHATDQQPVQCLVISGEKVTTAQGGYVLPGRLTDTSAAPISSPAVVATFYNANGMVVWVAQAVFRRIHSRQRRETILRLGSRTMTGRASHDTCLRHKPSRDRYRSPAVPNRRCRGLAPSMVRARCPDRVPHG